jgi:hypothetical protein
MDTWVWIVIVAGAVLVAAGVLFGARWAWRRGRSATLRRRFGPEYERVVSNHGRRRGEEQLRGRVRRHDKLVLRELPRDREHAAVEEVAQAQASFVDAPLTALRGADRVVFEVMRECGYPVEGAEARADAISVEHPALAARYRDAQKAFSEGEAAGVPDVGKLHGAFLTYREVLYVLVGHREVSEEAPDAARPDDPKSLRQRPAA